MANLALNDQKNRIVQVNRTNLIKTLEENLTKHSNDYQEAMGGYRAVLLNKAFKAFEDAKQKLAEREKYMLAKIEGLSDADIVAQRDIILLIDSVTVEMKVPRSYEEEYRAAIDMFKWDVRETIELTYAEFTCFVRDQWDWKSGFNAISELYKGIAAPRAVKR